MYSRLVRRSGTPGILSFVSGNGKRLQLYQRLRCVTFQISGKGYDSAACWLVLRH